MEVVLARAEVLQPASTPHTSYGGSLDYHGHLLSARAWIFTIPEARVHHVGQCEATPHEDA